MKDILRSILKQKRSDIPDKLRLELDKVINKQIIDFIKVRKVKSIASYYAINSEVSTLKTLENAQKNGVTLALPKIINEELIFSEWRVGDELIKNKLFLEPKNKNEIFPELILVPCLGYDEAGYRLGYGKGYYDKSLPKYTKAKKLIVAYSVQLCADIEKDPWDFKCDGIITDKGFLNLSYI